MNHFLAQFEEVFSHTSRFNTVFTLRHLDGTWMVTSNRERHPHVSVHWVSSVSDTADSSTDRFFAELERHETFIEELQAA